MTAKNNGHAGCSDYDGHAILVIGTVLRKFDPQLLRLALMMGNRV